MAFAPLLVGSLLAVPVVAAFDKLSYQKAREHVIASGTTVHPEIRLYPAMLGVILLPISLFVCPKRNLLPLRYHFLLLHEGIRSS
jgi:hypothetical protein